MIIYLFHNMLKYKSFYSYLLNESEDSPDYFYGRSGAGCLFLSTSTKRFLVSYRSGHVEQPYTWGGWGGAINYGESPEEGAIREAYEETGYDATGNTIIPLCIFSKNNFKYHNFLVLVEDEFTPRLDWETDNFRWVKFGEWPKPLHFGLQYLLDHSSKILEKYIK